MPEPSELWTHMAATHGLRLTESEEADILRAVEADREAALRRMNDRLMSELASNRQTATERMLAADHERAMGAFRQSIEQNLCRALGVTLPAEQEPWAITEARVAARNAQAQMQEIADRALRTTGFDMREATHGVSDIVTSPRTTATWNGIPIELAATEEDFFEADKPGPPSGRRFDIPRTDGRLV